MQGDHISVVFVPREELSAQRLTLVLSRKVKHLQVCLKWLKEHTVPACALRTAFLSKALSGKYLDTFLLNAFCSSSVKQKQILLLRMASLQIYQRSPAPSLNTS